jgi:hypothetical protein
MLIKDFASISEKEQGVIMHVKWKKIGGGEKEAVTWVIY